MSRKWLRHEHACTTRVRRCSPAASCQQCWMNVAHHLQVTTQLFSTHILRSARRTLAAEFERDFTRGLSISRQEPSAAPERCVTA